MASARNFGVVGTEPVAAKIDGCDLGLSPQCKLCTAAPHCRCHLALRQRLIEWAAAAEAAGLKGRIRGSLCAATYDQRVLLMARTSE